MGDLGTVFQGLVVILSVLTAVTGVVVWVTVRTERNASRIDQVRDRLREHLESCEKSQSDIFSILNEVRGDVREMKGRLKKE